jgi:uncharacterized membrane protein (UPF0127 family)/Skp family chaperone for outer membrane proteins
MQKRPLIRTLSNRVMSPGAPDVHPGLWCLAVLVLCCLFARTLRADDPRIAVVDLKLVYTNLQETIDTQHDLDDLQKQLDAMVKAHQAALTPADPKAAPKISIEDQDAKQLDFARQEQTLKGKMARIQCKQMARAWDQIHSATIDLAKARGLDLVLAGQNPALPVNLQDVPNGETIAKVIFGRDLVYTNVDLSSEVIAAVNKNYKSSAAPAAAQPTTTMKIGAKTFQLEIAGDDASREHGLMERDAMPADHGMIFVFPDVAYRNFWMHHTRFDLDIIFADAQGKIVSTAAMKAYDETGIPSDGPAKYAIELPAGTIASVKVGDVLSIPPAVNAAMKK